MTTMNGAEEFDGEELDDEFDGEEGEGGETKFTTPAGFDRVSFTVEGYYDPKETGQMIWTPRRVRLIDNSQESTKSSALILGELVEPATLGTTEQDKDERSFQVMPKGTSVGVWAKAGMKELLLLGGAIVWMAPGGKRKLQNRDQPMQLFQCAASRSGPKGEKLELLEDARKDSLIEPIAGDSQPWWLELLDDGGLAKAEIAMAAKQESRKAAREARNSGSGKRASKGDEAPIS